MTQLIDMPKDGIRYLEIGRVINGTVVKAIRPEDVAMIDGDGGKFFTSTKEGIAEMLTGSDERGDFIGEDDLFVTTYHGESGCVTIFSFNGFDCQITLKSTKVELPALESHPRRVIVDLFARADEE